MTIPFPSTPTTPAPETYSRLMSVPGHGYALFQPELDACHSKQYRMRGIGVGDVGVINIDGGFDFLFNVHSSRSDLNPPELPENFKMLQSVDISDDLCFSPGTHLLSLGVDQTGDS